MPRAVVKSKHQPVMTTN